MIVSTIAKGDLTCSSKEEIIKILTEGAALQRGDEIWISNNGEVYPCLNILVKNKNACVHYFKDEGEVQQSCGDDFDAEDVVFLAGNEEWAAPGYTIISFNQAIKCMEEFFDTLECPKCIKWDDL
ncbi:MAG: Imm1 family immunity protein [Lachnospiraceae bacterium]|nr:Imm1 family immunity protein [Lachnospiraceae bacterium]